MKKNVYPAHPSFSLQKWDGIEGDIQYMDMFVRLSMILEICHFLPTGKHFVKMTSCVEM